MRVYGLLASNSRRWQCPAGGKSLMQFCRWSIRIAQDDDISFNREIPLSYVLSRHKMRSSHMAIAIVTLTDPRDITNSTVNNEGMAISHGRIYLDARVPRRNTDPMSTKTKNTLSCQYVLQASSPNGIYWVRHLYLKWEFRLLPVGVQPCPPCLPRNWRNTRNAYYVHTGNTRGACQPRQIC
jgi:hypothetical protein